MPCRGDQQHGEDWSVAGGDCARRAAAPSPQPAPLPLPRLPQDNQHTIVLMQPTPVKGSRTFKDFDNVQAAIDGEGCTGGGRRRWRRRHLLPAQSRLAMQSLACAASEEPRWVEPQSHSCTPGPPAARPTASPTARHVSPPPPPPPALAASPRLAGICNDFERRLRELNPQLRSITYDIGDLYSWIDNMPDLR